MRYISHSHISLAFAKLRVYYIYIYIHICIEVGQLCSLDGFPWDSAFWLAMSLKILFAPTNTPDVTARGPWGDQSPVSGPKRCARRTQLPTSYIEHHHTNIAYKPINTHENTWRSWWSPQTWWSASCHVALQVAQSWIFWRFWSGGCTLRQEATDKD